jgi:prepilin-type N-terminal cleavage/methylation domain-containing protein
VDELMKTSTRRLQKEQGLSLLELMIALTVLAVGLLGMLSMQTQALQGSRNGKHVSQAARIAEEQMGFLQRQPWAAVPTSAWSTPRIVNGPVNGAGPSAPQQYSVLWRVQAGPATTLRTLDVQVNWTNPEAPAGSPVRTYVISSVRHNDP